MTFRIRAALAFACLSCSSFASFGQDIHLTGTVKTVNGTGIPGASVSLANAKATVHTDANGAYSIIQKLAALPRSAQNAVLEAPAFVNNTLYFGVYGAAEQVCIETFTLSGRRISAAVNATLLRGNYALTAFLPRGTAQVCFVRVKTGSQKTVLKAPPFPGQAPRQSRLALLDEDKIPSNLARRSTAVDTILVWAQGYARARSVISSYAGIYNFTLEKTVFALLSPADSAVVTATRKPVLKWGKDTNAVSYDVYLNLSRTDYNWADTGASLLDNYTQIAAGTPDDSIIAPALPDRWTYRWYVVSVDGAGNRKASALRTFSVYNPTIDTSATAYDSVAVINGCRDLNKNGTIEPYENWRLPVAVRVRDLLSRMSKTEKAMQLFFNAFNYPGAGWSSSLSIGDLHTVQIRAAQAKWGIPVVPASDFISGYTTTFPSQAALAATRDLGIIYKCAAMQRDEQLIQAYKGTFSPTAEVGTKVLYARIGDGCGENADFGAAMIKAMVAACHDGPELNPRSLLAIPGHWLAGQDDIPFDTVTIAYHLKPWRAALAAGAAAVMAGLGTNSAYFTNTNGASTNRQMLGFLRDSLRFDGPIFTEWLDKSLWLDCLLAGADVLTGASPGDVDLPTFASQVPDSVIDAACARVLSVKFRMGLFENPYGNADWNNAVQTDPAHAQLARDAAKASLTLLKNNGVLPLTLSAGDTLIVAGERANDGNSYTGWGSSFHDTTIWLTLSKRAAAVQAGAVYDSAVAVHTNAKAAVCVIGEENYTNIPSWGANTVDIPLPDLELITSYKHAGIPVIVVIIMPRPYALGWPSDSADALVAAYRLGDGGGSAVAGLVFGDFTPGGRLPWQLPRSIDQIGLNDPKSAIEQWDLPYDIGATGQERQKIRGLIATGRPCNTGTGDSLYGDPLYQYGFGIQGWGK
ncbi:MAG TPA: glycoside hydrolase family 3 C-terminal domain-containing protein [Chitinivibrionales bacterium]|nr:glycoside hydrolase family 3 C-terminal domain-containing protein [Chitinivibrionales bacterium]